MWPVSSHDQQDVGDTALFLCQESTWIMYHPMTNRKWVRLLYFYVKHSHECLTPWPIGSEWHHFISLLHSHQSRLILWTQFVSLHLCEAVSSIMSIPWPIGCEWHTSYLCQAISSIVSYPMTNSMWVSLCHFFAGSLLNHVSSIDQQNVSDTALLLCQQSHQSCLIPLLTGSEWLECFISLPGSHQSCLIPWTQFVSFYGFARQSHQSCLSHNQQGVSDTASFLCQAVSSIMSHSMTNRMWVTMTLLYCFASSLINHVSSHDW